MSDDELDNFHINSKTGKEKIFKDATTEFGKFSPAAQDQTIAALEFIIVSKTWNEHWRKIIPHEVPLDEIIDKESYACDLFMVLSDREPNQNLNINDVFLSDEIGPGGLQFYE